MISSKDKDSIQHNSNHDNEQVSLDSQSIADSTAEDSTAEDSTAEDSTAEDSTAERITKLEAQLEHERDSRLRAQAEIENVRRRSALDVENAHRFAIERFAIELLQVIDNLERALEMSDTLASTIEGIELTLKSMLDTVRKFGIDVVSETSVPFNPEVHQAMTMRESDEYEPNHVMSVMQKGYTLNGRLIRPAMVVVATRIK